MKALCILGSTGSIGRSCLRVVRDMPGQFRVISLSAGRNMALLAEQIAEFSPSHVAVGTSDEIDLLRGELRKKAYHEPLTIAAGREGRIVVATLPEVGIVVSASHGVTGLMATYEAVKAGKRVGLANKESLVVAGELITREARKSGTEVLPIDSEHCAIHQCLRAGETREVERLILTGSGGPFLNTPIEQFASITPEQALNHPVWKMGGRITVDSATLMNKGLEIIEAHWLFGLPPERIEVLIHPESIIHSMVEFNDRCVLAQLAVADMRIPIQYALTYPERAATNGDSLKLDLLTAGSLHFRAPDTSRFPCLTLGWEAIRQGGCVPCSLNAADETAVTAFLNRRLPFASIPRVIERVMLRTPRASLGSMEDVLACDQEARAWAEEVVREESRSVN
ncbi:MAG TPA: 1-deoxy-D-xylulose-5-phosphate reductoisomerase [Terriglobia bacterium]|nr:1-deoxy-D-xylulose-5-phosphate reductoisomerase [Terriglobia bacterium]